MGQAAFFASWVPPGTPGEHVGLGPLFNAASCNACHAGGFGAQGPAGDGVLPPGLVIHLAAIDGVKRSAGDPAYGRIFNTSAATGVRPEGAVRVSYTEFAGYYYPFGPRWVLRVPHYHLENLAYGPLAPATIVRPRIAPALFGVGLLETLSAAAAGGPAPAGHVAAGRLGWQADEASIRDQTAVALAFDMGITSRDQPQDDCTPRQSGCDGDRPGASPPEMSPELLDALVEFERSLPVATPRPLTDESRGRGVFDLAGCSVCHRTRPAARPADPGPRRSAEPYTDLRLHDLGPRMADENAAGRKVPTLWRTAPLWGIAHRLEHSPAATFLHDGRARSVEEAILWHGGEAAKATYAFERLTTADRAVLLEWIETR